MPCSAVVVASYKQSRDTHKKGRKKTAGIAIRTARKTLRKDAPYDLAGLTQ